MKRKLVSALRTAFILSLTALFSLQASGQRPNPLTDQYSPGLMSELQRLRDGALASDYAYIQLAHLCNNIGPRLSGSAQAQQAVQYVAAEMRRLGLDVRLEKVMVPHWVRGVETGELVKFAGQATGTTQKVVLTALGGSVATPNEGLTAEVIVVDSFEQLQSLGREKVAGKIVLFDVRFDKQMAAQGFALDAYGRAVVYRGAGASVAARLGAVASLVRSVGGADYRLPHTGALGYAEDSPKIPAAAVTAEDADLITYLTAQGPVRLHLTLTPRTLPDVESYNVVADIKGFEHPEQIVIVSGHLDSWDLGTGAIDDGAGVAVAMQTAQLIKQFGLRPRRTIRVIAWMNEENGLVGGKTYAQDHQKELENHIAAFESDLGAGHPIGFSAHVSERAMELLLPISTVLGASGAGVTRRSENSEGADVSPLDAAGVPTLAPIQDNRTYFNYHHTAADTLDKVVPRELAENAAVAAVLAYAVANLREPLPREPRGRQQ
ncbi:MAG TPA: M20/M25/M40 family metallo-hydrolase [Blastocatellia bacterium]|nr:M20/M25/M40 family metallo-hydrolase [Blastocatellia bacterium]